MRTFHYMDDRRFCVNAAALNGGRRVTARRGGEGLTCRAEIVKRAKFAV